MQQHQMSPERRLGEDLQWHAAHYRTPLSSILAAHQRVADQFRAEQYKALEQAERNAMMELELQPGGVHAQGPAPALRRARYIALRCHADYLVRKNPSLIQDDTEFWAEVAKAARTVC